MSRVLYVVGTGFSGSTLLAFLLDAHPRMATVGEATGPFRRWDDHAIYPCSCGAPLAECTFWKRVAEEMARRGFEFGPNRWELRFALTENRWGHQLLSQSLRSNRADAVRDALVLGVPSWRARLQALARRNEAFAESVLAVTGAEVFADVSKDPVRARYLHRLTRLDLRVVHLVRDSLGFVSSNAKNRSEPVDAGIRIWRRMAGHVRRLEGLLPPERFLRVRYEDLCTRVEEQLGRIQRFAGVEPVAGPIAFRSGTHHIIGNRMRLEGSREVVLDESWRERLTRAEAEEIRRRTARERRLFGYA